jgi:hypothetical protein
MKKMIITLAALLVFSVSIHAQTEKTNYSYSFINEYGPYFGGMASNSAIGFTGVFVNGIKINNQDVIGLGLGYEIGENETQSIPIFLNYRHIFPSSVALKPVVNFAIGTRLSYWNVQDIIGYDPIYLYPIYGPEKEVHDFGLYSTIAAGFNVHAFSLTSGFFLRTAGERIQAGFEVKVGYTL